MHDVERRIPVSDDPRFDLPEADAQRHGEGPGREFEPVLHPRGLASLVLRMQREALRRVDRDLAPGDGTQCEFIGEERCQ